MDKAANIFVICGGFSEEREVSLRSGNNVFEALLRLGYTQSKLFDLQDTRSLMKLTELKMEGKIDLAFLVTHGTYGEDGCMQGFFELLDIPYLGSKVKSSANCMDKIVTKEILAANKLPVLKSFLARDVFENNVNDAVLGGKLIVKPYKGGSSVDVFKFNSIKDFQRQFEANKTLIARLDEFFVERFVEGTEVTTSLIKVKKDITSQNQDRLCYDKETQWLSLPILELRPKSEFYDYQAKYTKGMTEFILPAEINKNLEAQVHKAAIQALEALDCCDFARVDMMIDSELNKPFILEINTLPGMTDLSDLPAQAKAAGISYDELVENMITKYSLKTKV